MKLFSVVAFAVLTMTGCALTSKGDAAQTRFFGVESFSKEPPVSAPARRSLRLGHVEASTHLRERLVYREPNGEIGFYDERRWGERPENYVRRALTHALYEHARLQQALHGAAPTLDVEILAFEEVRRDGGAPVARVRTSVALHDDRVVEWHETITVERPIPPPPRPGAPDANATVRALSDALHGLAHQIADHVVREIQKMSVERSASSP